MELKNQWPKTRTDYPKTPLVLYIDRYSCNHWPSWDEAGAKPYCKTQTSLFYAPVGFGGSLEPQGWGWPALVKYTKALEHMKPDLSTTYTFPGIHMKQDDFV